MIRPRFFIENRSFFTTSDFFHADLLSDENGDWLHTFSALLAAATAAWHSLFHHGPRSSFGVVGGGRSRGVVEIPERFCGEEAI